MLPVLCLLAQQTPSDEKKPKWDVASPPGASSTIPIDTHSGTWMSVDVGPQGDEIVFDLLGDIYSLPIGGGTAKALTSGVPWDMQPRFSPDGKRIAFTSDRGGGDNIWVMNRDGSQPRQVTKEDFRLLNSPAWTPDASLSPRASISPPNARSAPARSGSTMSPAAAACR